MSADGDKIPVFGSPEDLIAWVEADSARKLSSPEGLRGLIAWVDCDPARHRVLRYPDTAETYRRIAAAIRDAVAAERGRAYRAMGEVLDDLDAAGLNESEAAERLRDRMDSFRA